MRRLLFSIVLSLISFIAYAANKPTVYLLATGGTIAGTASSQTSTTYKAGSLTAEQIIASVPGLDNLANIKYEQVYNKDSGNVTLSDWLKLANEVNKVINDPNVSAVVVTHGTDTLEETAYFLDLVIKTKKPIIIVGAMRPATAISADGPLNLYNAVAVAINPKSIGRGVMVVMNDGIYDGRDVTKTNTTNVDTFQSPNTGPIGHVVMGKVNYHDNGRANAYDAPFNISNIKSLPSVAVVYENVGVDTEMLDNILKTKNLKGIVIAGVGDGNIPDYEKDFLINARKKGIVIVRSSRVGSGEVSYDYNNLDTTYDLIAGDDLNPQKARILLMLSLLTTNDVKQIQKNFYTY
ncbi:asparaginase [Aquella oligotrophica]|uniref:Asparaginase n=1 Tax=Aquella oligotrophica TaxID=2067065 RepID=A0A2I7N535_9NEIS|nr:asparaginase [Aquella oligotrophica]AUR51558.1 asparaginase [Aquella oligotrophica]